MIRFGSRLDVYLPDGARPLVAEGQTAIAGETVLADLRAGDPRRTFRSRLDRLTRPAIRPRAVARRAPQCVYIARHVVSAVRPRPLAAARRRFRAIPVRTLLPNLITLLALCAGLTAIRLAVEDKLEWALAAIVFAALLDGIDGRIARMLKGTSRFGAELDSLADFVNFGVAPALILYFWGLHELGNRRLDRGAWCSRSAPALRLARFNVMIDDPEPAGLGGKLLHRRAGAGRRHHRAAADLSQFSRRRRRARRGAG